MNKIKTVKEGDKLYDEFGRVAIVVDPKKTEDSFVLIQKESQKK